MIHLPFQRFRPAAMAAGILFLAAGIPGAIFDRHAFFVSWLFAFVFWLGLSLGCLNVAMMHYLTGGRWGNVTRRFLEAGYMTLPAMAICFVPLLFGLHILYPWARPEDVAADRILQQKAAYENFSGFLLRAILFFGSWIVIAARLRRYSLQQDATVDPAPTIKLRTLSGPGIVLVPLTMTFASVDWIMSIEPAWFSTIFGVILLSGQVLAALAFIIILLAQIQSHPPLPTVTTPKHFHDLGNLLLAFVMFWTYVAFSQFLVVYSGNQPREIGWYLHRVDGTWKWLIGLVALFHFFTPFFLLLFRAIKTSRRALVTIAAMILVVHVADIFWIIMPTFYPGGISIHWTDFTAWLGMGGIWLAIFFTRLAGHPLVAQNDPRQENTLLKTADAK